MAVEIIRLSVNAVEVPATTSVVADYAFSAGLNKKSCFELRVVLAEALNNIIAYGFTSLAANATVEQIKIYGHIEENLLCITIVDLGTTMIMPKDPTFPNLLNEGGRGWPIIFSWVDMIDYTSNDHGNFLTLKKNLI